jgi:hypothetical protein
MARASGFSVRRKSRSRSTACPSLVIRATPASGKHPHTFRRAALKKGLRENGGIAQARAFSAVYANAFRKRFRGLRLAPGAVRISVGSPPPDRMAGEPAGDRSKPGAPACFGPVCLSQAGPWPRPAHLPHGGQPIPASAIHPAGSASSARRPPIGAVPSVSTPP